MNTFNRRQIVTIGAFGLAGLMLPARAQELDGVGPNRGIAAKTFRSKFTCDNSSVQLSDISARLSMPEDFGGSACQLIADSHEGPFFTCSPSIGKNIAAGQQGQPLTVAMRVVDGNCNPAPNSFVDIWACNAEGSYSGYSYDPNTAPPMVRAVLFGHIEPDLEQRFCRGVLMTDADGIAEFDTIYPGYYYGVPIHIHFKVHVDGKLMLTSQANISEAWNERIMQTPPYNAARAISRNTAATSFPKFTMIERSDRLLAVLDLVVPN